MNPIENREIRGITNKLVVTIGIAVVTLTSGGIMFYNGLMNKIDKVSNTQETRKIEVDLQFNAINENIQGVKDDVKELKGDIKELRRNN